MAKIPKPPKIIGEGGYEEEKEEKPKRKKRSKSSSEPSSLG